MPCWTDLQTPDVAAATAFYTAVLGWDWRDTGPEYGGYAIAHVNGAAAAGIGPAQSGAPTAWTIYLASDDVDATAAAVPGLGGTVVLEPGDVGELGRLCIAADPSGAVFGVWQAGTNIGAGLVNEPGGLTWEDLRSTDPDAARAFYVGLFGYEIRSLDGAPPDYALFHLPGDDAPLGGMGGMMGQEGMPSHWSVYFAVADADAAAGAAEAAGGTVIAPAFDTPYGRMAALADPAGAAFLVAATDVTTQPNRAG